MQKQKIVIKSSEYFSVKYFFSLSSNLIQDGPYSFTKETTS